MRTNAIQAIHLLCFLLSSAYGLPPPAVVSETQAVPAVSDPAPFENDIQTVAGGVAQATQGPGGLPTYGGAGQQYEVRMLLKFYNQVH